MPCLPSARRVGLYFGDLLTLIPRWPADAFSIGVTQRQDLLGQRGWEAGASIEGSRYGGPFESVGKVLK